MNLTPNQLALVCAATLADATRYTQYINEQTTKYKINTQRRAAMFFAQVAHESGKLARVEENLNYSAKRLTQVWPGRFPTLAAAAPYAMNPRALANKTYGGRMGNRPDTDDGWKYRGRGLKQLTGFTNYQKMGRALGANFIDFPESVATPLYAVATACEFWSWADGNRLADADNFKQLTININGGLTGYEDGNDDGLDDRVEMLAYTNAKLLTLGNVFV